METPSCFFMVGSWNPRDIRSIQKEKGPVLGCFGDLLGMKCYVMLCGYYYYPIGSMYGIFTYIWLIFMVNVSKYTIHGWYGY